MSTGSVVGSSRLDIGKVVSDSFEMIRRNLSPFALTGLILIALPSFLAAAVRFSIRPATPFSPVLLLIALVSVVLTAAYYAALFYGTELDVTGRRVSVGEMLSAGFSNVLPMLGLAIMVLVPVYLGLFLFIVPGVLLHLRWSVAGPALVAEKRGILAAMGRSAALTKDRRWAIFLLYLAIGVVILAFEVALFAVAGGFAGMATLAAGGSLTPGNIFLGLIVGPAVAIAFNGILAVISAMLFHHLRVSREGATPQIVAEVFG